MDGERQRRIEELYHAALACADEERSSLLDRSAPDLRREVEQLLANDASRPSRPAWEHAGDATVTILKPGSRIGRYEIEALLGAGGMGQVFRARDTQLRRLVAIKTSQELFRDRFQIEARAISALNHPHICTLY
ncbi:MAG: hypothetical protein KGN84_21790, partial [Acidobacteriota bacterium]|nr:hypothetical protein [Acidobacteriota bacterium]